MRALNISTPILSKPFVAALTDEIRAAFSVSELPVVEAFLAIDPQTIPQEIHESYMGIRYS